MYLLELGSTLYTLIGCDFCGGLCLLKREVLLTWDEDFTSVGLRANVYRLLLGIMLVYSKVLIIDSPLTSIIIWDSRT